MSGPNATFGKEFNIVKKGLNTFDKNLFHQNIVAIIKLIKLEIKMLIVTSYIVIKICLNKIPCLIKLIILSY